MAGATKYGFYFANGGINVDFDKGWRTDGAGVAGIYWRVNSQDSFGIANGTTDNSRSAYGSSTSGAAVMLDDAACFHNAGVHFTARNVKHEINTNQTAGLAPRRFTIARRTRMASSSSLTLRTCGRLLPAA